MSDLRKITQWTGFGPRECVELEQRVAQAVVTIYVSVIFAWSPLREHTTDIAFSASPHIIFRGDVFPYASHSYYIDPTHNLLSMHSRWGASPMFVFV